MIAEGIEYYPREVDDELAAQNVKGEICFMDARVCVWFSWYIKYNSAVSCKRFPPRYCSKRASQRFILAFYSPDERKLIEFALP